MLSLCTGMIITISIQQEQYLSMRDGECVLKAKMWNPDLSRLPLILSKEGLNLYLYISISISIDNHPMQSGEWFASADCLKTV